MIVYTHIIFNLHLKNIFTLKKSSRFANQLMEKAGNWVAIAKKVGISPEEERNFTKSIWIFTSNLTLGQFQILRVQIKQLVSP